MGLHFVVLAKLNLIANSQTSFSTPLLATLIGPFLFRLFLNFRPIRRVYNNIIHNWRLFFFQLDQIAFHSDHVPAGTGRRFQRAVRLVSDRISQARRPSTLEFDEDSLHALSMIAL
ncbi:hypothetical protein LguiA_034134 [Lonicera macranthoides]